MLQGYRDPLEWVWRCLYAIFVRQNQEGTILSLFRKIGCHFSVNGVEMA